MENFEFIRPSFKRKIRHMQYNRLLNFKFYLWQYCIPLNTKYSRANSTEEEAVILTQMRLGEYVLKFLEKEIERRDNLMKRRMNN